MEYKYVYYGDLKHNLVRTLSNPDDILFMVGRNLWVDKNNKLNYQSCDYQGSTPVLTVYSDININNNVITYENTNTRLPSTTVGSYGRDVWKMGNHIYYDSYQANSSHYELNNNNKWIEHTWTVKLLNGNTYTVTNGMSHSTSYWVDFNGAFVKKFKNAYYAQVYYKEPGKPIHSLPIVYNASKNRWEEYSSASGYQKAVGAYLNYIWDDGTNVYLSWGTNYQLKWNETAKGWENTIQYYKDSDGDLIRIYPAYPIKIENEFYTYPSGIRWQNNAVVDILKWNKSLSVWEYYNTITLPEDFSLISHDDMIFRDCYVKGNKVYLIFMDTTLRYIQRMFELPIIKE